VKDPRYGHVYNLKPLSSKDIKVSTDEYDYYFRVCGEITEHCRPGAHSVSSRGSRFDRLQLAAVAKESLNRVQLTAIDRSLWFSNT